MVDGAFFLKESLELGAVKTKMATSASKGFLMQSYPRLPPMSRTVSLRMRRHVDWHE